MKKILLKNAIILLLICFASIAHATVYYSKAASGNWTSSATWSTVTYGNATNTGTYPGVNANNKEKLKLMIPDLKKMKTQNQ